MSAARLKRLPVLAVALLAVALLGAGDEPTTRPTDKPDSPASNLDYWLDQAEPVEEDAEPEAGPTSRPTTRPAGPPDDVERPGACPGINALPGVVKLSDGRVLAGWVMTTPLTPWLVYVDGEGLWRRVPPAAALGIEAVVVKEQLELRWRWKGMGEPERVYTGKRYPFRRLKWQFNLADGSTITGTVKGQPLWVRCGDEKHGPFVLHERQKGEDDQALDDLVYVEHVILSRRAMGAALSEGD